MRKTIGGVHFEWTPFLCRELSKNSTIVYIVQNNSEIKYIESIIQKISKNIEVITIPEHENDIQTTTSRAAGLYRLCNSKINTVGSSVSEQSEQAYSTESFPSNNIEHFSFWNEKNEYELRSAWSRWRAKRTLTKQAEQLVQSSDSKKEVCDARDQNPIVVSTIKAISQCSTQTDHFEQIIEISRTKFINLNKKLQEFGYIKADLTEFPGQYSLRGGIIDIFPVTYDTPFRLDFFGDTVESIKSFSPETQQSAKKYDQIIITKAQEIPGSSSFFDYINDDTVFLSHINLDQISEDDYIKLLPFEIDGENFAKTNNFSGKIRTEESLKNFIKDTQKYKKSIVAAGSKGAIHIISDILSDLVELFVIESTEEANYGISVVQMDLKEGFVKDGFVKDNTVAFYTEKQIFGQFLKSSQKTSKKKIFKNYSNMRPGNYVVHKKHGVAMFEGLSTMNIDGSDHDFLQLLYKGGDKLFVPVENIDLVSRYGSDNQDVELNKLGSSSWETKREKIRKKLLIVADNLLKIAAQRKIQKIDPIEIDHEKYEKFCQKFPYMETDDQISAINDVINDLEGSIPSDRLICGDVGFGKTEVALRASFIMASSGRQVILLAPTTILVSQHFKNFSKRFEDTGIEILQLSRFVNSSNMKNSIEKINSRVPCIIIATHSILSNKINFSNIGMLIIDEEQHFGVKQKEFIKSVKNNIHVLAMTATPIPRTLQMSISGIVDISVIASPPPDRLPVKTYVMEWNADVLKSAIHRELDRKGQIFVVSPRVEFLNDLFEKVSKIVPDAIIKTIHGKSREMEETIDEFCDNKINILVSTNIIDSGIDIQNANTIIIHRADMFGLSQLYQLRGRVGRKSNIQGYAYMMLPPSQKLTSQKLTKEAEKRLQAIQELGALGSGFTLASHDLDIRGAGNIVGEEQSGYIKEIGAELYQNMLECALLMKDKYKDISPQINIGIPVMIPISYIESNNLRMSMYRRIGDLKTTSEIEGIELELADRFGPPPKELKNLLTLIRIKLLCMRANIEKIDVGKNGVLISFYNNTCNNPEELINFVNKNQETIKIRPDQKLIITNNWANIQERTKDIIRIVKMIGVL
ncbi:MAG: transcription-repair coupling factor [Holosporales bacterium]|jgi:transcription-repair coupling factor (superfamily II helicase)|nr:transcription-repair coupling factor [Holosporales bacterium]